MTQTASGPVLLRTHSDADWVCFYIAEITSLIAADIVHDFLSMMLQPRDEKVAADTLHYNPGVGAKRDEL